VVGLRLVFGPGGIGLYLGGSFVDITCLLAQIEVLERLGVYSLGYEVRLAQPLSLGGLVCGLGFKPEVSEDFLGNGAESTGVLVAETERRACLGRMTSGATANAVATMYGVPILVSGVIIHITVASSGLLLDARLSNEERSHLCGGGPVGSFTLLTASGYTLSYPVS